MEYFQENLYVVLFFWFWCGAIAAYIAAGKSRNVFLWFALGFAFPVLGVIVIVLMEPPLKAVEESGKRTAVSLGESADFRKCPYCAEAIRKEAIKCRHCQSEVAPLEAQKI